ncbi:thioredoxin domain-containing protein [Tellurirhabdus bombi]|uniref:thioredoxin domain-containing protein n=1 Tax=Tellurirhabdus bombi TaxID=2907205 RepID=UPI001F45DE34|nr:thioredoxin domain-containing protein [Tellurirhabdus bombi]
MRYKSVFTFLALLTSISGFAQKPVLLTADRSDSLLRAQPNIQVLDVRTAGEYANGHLTNSRNLDIRDSTFAQKLKELDPNKPVLVYCLSGGRSAKASTILANQGFKQVYDMQGGFVQWTAGKRAIEGGKTNPKGALSMEEFKKLTKSTKPVLVDFYAKWCAPCQQMLPMIDRLKKELADKVTIVTIDYDQNRSLAQQLGVDEIPTFLLYKDEKIQWRGLGTVQEETFKEKIRSHQ